jgi:hypothetical protein
VDSLGLWQNKYLPRWQEMQARETSLRKQAFIDWESKVCFEPLRQMTLNDLLFLNGAGNPFVCEGQINAASVLQFIWILHVENKGSRIRKWWHRRCMIKRVLKIKAVNPLAACQKEIAAYIDAVFQDAPKPGAKQHGSRPLGVCFVATILVRLTSGVGPFDPSTGKIWMETPLARIFQFIKVLNRNESGEKFTDFSPSDGITSEWLAESNALASVELKAV